MNNESTRTSRLKSVKRGTLKQPLRYLFYGAEGVGKSTLACDSESPIIFDIENGSSHLNIDRYSFRDDEQGYVPSTLSDVYDGIADLLNTEHDYKTLIIDTMSSLEALVWQHVCDAGKKRSIEEFGYGKGYTAAVDEFRVFLHRLDELRTKGNMAIILVGHAHTKNFKNPISDDYDRIQLRMHEKAASVIREWCDVVGYCAFEESASINEGERAKGFSTGRRFLHLERSAAWDAKSRLSIPTRIEMSHTSPWRPFAESINAAQGMSLKDVTEAIQVELKRIGDSELTQKVKESVTKSKENKPMLLKYLHNLKNKESQTESN